MKELTLKEIKQFQIYILSWYEENKRDLPWRRTRDPYHILISEVMSQQTQIGRVIPKYEAWLIAFPTIQALASAPTQQVLRLWSGLGYNRRALYLQKCAKLIVSTYNGIFPTDETLLLTLPGIGAYTARALLCFAFNQQVTVVDTNIRKVILTEVLKTSEVTEKELAAVAEELLPKDKAYDWNQALMDYAAIMIKDKKHPMAQKQSQFKDSDRYYRGKIIRLLAGIQRMTIKDAREALCEGEKSISQERFEKIIKGLLKDQLIEVGPDSISLSSL